MLGRRSFLGLLGVAPVALPIVAKEVLASSTSIAVVEEALIVDSELATSLATFDMYAKTSRSVEHMLGGQSLRALEEYLRAERKKIIADFENRSYYRG